jgi:hypothetical protein
MTCTHDHELPIHLAALHGGSPATLIRLHKAFPEGLMRPTQTQGWLPLHLACQRTVKPDVIRTLVELEPEAAKVKSKLSGCLPLHIAAKNGCSAEVIQMLFNANPAAARQNSFVGETPLSCAAGKSESFHALNKLSSH